MNSAAEQAGFDWFGEQEHQTSLRRRTVRSVLVSILSNVGTKMIRFVSIAILARLLVPEDFGVVAILTATIGAAGLVKDLGLPSATLRFPAIDHAQISNLFWINQGAALLMMVVIICTAPLMQRFFGHPELLHAATVMVLLLPIEATMAQHQALLRRAHHFKSLAGVTALAATMTAAIAIGLANQGLGYWALILGSLCGQTAAMLLAWRLCNWRPSRPHKLVGTAALVRFGTRMMGFNMLGFCAVNLHNLLIGRLWGAASVGQYSRAATLHSITLGGVTEPVSLVIPAGMARLSAQPQRLKNYYYKACALAVTMAIPIAFVGLVLPHEFVGLLLGEQWQQAGAIFQFLSIGVIPQVISNSTGWVYLSVGNPKLMLWWGVIGWSCFVAAISLGAQFGINGIAIGASTVNLLLMFPGLAFAFKGTALRISELMVYVLKPMVAGALATAISIGVLHAFSGDEGFQRFIVGGVSFVVAYGAILMGIPGHRRLILGTIQELRAVRSPREGQESDA